MLSRLLGTSDKLLFRLSPPSPTLPTSTVPKPVSTPACRQSARSHTPSFGERHRRSRLSFMEVVPAGNYATCVSLRPFILTDCTLCGDEGLPLKRLADDRETRTLVPIATARRYVKPSSELSSLGLETVFAAQCLAKKFQNSSPKAEAEVYVATVWCLCAESRYTLTCRFTDGESAAESDSVSHEASFRTGTLHSFPVRKSLDGLFIQNAAVLQRCDAADMLNAQGDEDMMLMWPPEANNLASAADALRFLLYDGLFALPDSVSVNGNLLWLLQIPNGSKRFVLDLAGGAPTTDSSAASTPLFPWRRHSAVRKLIRQGERGKYGVRVHDSREGILHCLDCAKKYHEQQHKSTWLSDAFNSLLASTADMCCYENGACVMYGTPGLRLLCVELVDQESGKPLAGCCGFACGSVYHDYTMYTLERGPERFGTCLTKLIGEALQKCGYDMWYWGFRLGYMSDFEQRYGGTNMSRTDFYERWCVSRDRAPSSGSLWEFLRAGKGMVPHVATESSSAVPNH